MHTMELENGWIVHYHGDFSGSVEFVRRDGLAAVIPFSVLGAVVAEKVRDGRIKALEQASTDDLLK